MVILSKMQRKFNIEKIKLIIGLGNPEEKFKNTYHNIGQLFIDYFEKNTKENKYKTLKSENYMNNSGFFVKNKMNYFNLKPEEILIIHDDSDINIGNYKISFEKNSAGHKGINSIIEQLKSKEFWRVRIGIRPKEYIGKAENFVLKEISKENQTLLQEIFEKIKNELLA